jgi:hypothetical protein
VPGAATTSPQAGASDVDIPHKVVLLCTFIPMLALIWYVAYMDIVREKNIKLGAATLSFISCLTTLILTGVIAGWIR